MQPTMEHAPNVPTEFSIHPMRWYVLFVAAIFNVTNAMIWISFAPAANYASDYYAVNITAINMFSVCYFIISIPTMFLATYLIDKYSLRFGLQLGCTIQFCAATIRLFGTFDFVPQDVRYPLSITGQCLMAVAQPFAMGVPTLVSDSWFPPKERIAATALTSMSNPLGIMFGQIVTPVMVASPSDIPAMNFTVCAIGMGAALSAILVPPRKAHHAEGRSSFGRDLLTLIKNKYYVVLLITVGGAIALVSVLLTYFSQMMCPQGYDENFAGMCAALMLVFSFIGSVLATILATITKLYKEITKIMFAIAAVSAVALVLCIQHVDVKAGIITCSIAFGFVGFAAYPLFLELAAECTYPIDESKSAGFIVTSSQIIGIIMVIVLEVIAQDASSNGEIMAHQVCTTNPDEFGDVRDMTIPNFFMAGVGCFIALLFIIAFRGKYLRMEAEKEKMEALSRTQTPTEEIAGSETSSEKN